MKTPKMSDSQIRRLTRYIQCKHNGLFPYYTVPTEQAKLLAKNGFIHREFAADLTLTHLGVETLKSVSEPEFIEILEDGVQKGMF